MTIKEIKYCFKKQLEDFYPSEELESFFHLLSEKYLCLSRLEIALNPDREISKKETILFETALLNLKQKEPIQYIIGDTEFYSLPFKVTNAVLIPRSETEELVDWIINERRENREERRENRKEKIEKQTILDIGTGSGCIAISLAKNLTNVKLTAIDISSEALKIAKHNAHINHVEVDFLEVDILNLKRSFSKFDIIVSNPPYVREAEKEEMQSNVLDYEPKIALFVSNHDPLLFYRKIAEFAKNHLRNNGFLFFEINEYLPIETKKMLLNLGFSDIELKKDIFGKYRMIKCIYNE